MLKTLVKVSGVSLAYHRLHTARAVASPQKRTAPLACTIAVTP